MKEVVIEIDGVRHQLIEKDYTDCSDSCDECSLSNICNNIEGCLCFCVDGFGGSQNSLFKIVETKNDNSFGNYTNFGSEYY